MRKNLLTALIGAAIAISIAATSTSLMTVKPAQPKDIRVFYSNSHSVIQHKIFAYDKQGFIVHNIMPDKFSMMVVMYKY